MISKGKIEELIEGIIESSENKPADAADQAGLSELGYKVDRISEPLYTNGRRGEFYRVEFEYTVSLLDDEPEDPENPVLENSYRRSVRVFPDGKVSGLSEKELLSSRLAPITKPST